MLQDAAGATTRATSRALHAAAATSGATASSTSGATRTASRPKVAEHRVRPEPLGAHRAAELRRRREALHRGAADGLKVGDKLVIGPDADIGRATPAAQNIPLGTAVHIVELLPGPRRARRALGRRVVPAHGEGRRLRAAAAAVGRGAQVPPRLPRASSARSATSITRTSSSARPAAAAGCGIRPHVRGVAMNPVDHPMGGGEGKSSGGRHPCSPWGKPTKGYKTRKRKLSDS